MRRTSFPRGWDERKTRRVLTHYERQTKREAIAEDDAAFESSETVMTIPRDLVPKVRKLIAKRQGS